MKTDDLNVEFGLSLPGLDTTFQKYVDYALHIVCALIITHIIYMNFTLCLILLGCYAVYKIAYNVYDVNNICPGVGVGGDCCSKNNPGSSRLQNDNDDDDNDKEISNSLENLCNDDWVGDGDDSDTIHDIADGEGEVVGEVGGEVVGEVGGEVVGEVVDEVVDEHKANANSSTVLKKRKRRPTLSLEYDEE